MYIYVYIYKTQKNIKSWTLEVCYLNFFKLYMIIRQKSEKIGQSIVIIVWGKVIR